jgi:hypothetical protein
MISEACLDSDTIQGAEPVGIRARMEAILDENA